MKCSNLLLRAVLSSPELITPLLGGKATTRIEPSMEWMRVVTAVEELGKVLALGLHKSCNN